MFAFAEIFRRVFRLERDKANADSTNKRFDAVLIEIRDLRTDLRSHEIEDRAAHKEVLAEIRETNRHLSTTNATLANLAGQFESVKNAAGAANGQR